MKANGRNSPSMAHNSQEVEIKLPVADRKRAQALLRAAGFLVSRRRVFETNTVFDTPELALRAARELLRVRQAGGVATLTYKGPPAVSRHKSRGEVELTVADAGVMGAIFERLGFHPAFRYDKYRTEYREPRQSGVATIDETPVGVYLELEGPSRWIDRTARRLGFEQRDYITASYGTLYLAWCERNGVSPSNMVFPHPRRPH